MNRKTRHFLRMAWFAVTRGKPWPFYDCWAGVLEKGPGGFPETDPLQYSRISKEISGLPVDIFVQDSDAYLDTDAPNMVLFHNGYGSFLFSRLVPLSVSRHPRILMRHFGQNLTDRDLSELKSFIRQRRRELRSLAGGPSGPDRTCRYVRALTERRSKARFQ